MNFTQTFIEYRKVNENYKQAFFNYGLLLADKPKMLDSLDPKILLVQRLIDYHVEVERCKLKNSELQQELATIGSSLLQMFKLGEVAPLEQIEIEISPAVFVKVWYSVEHFINYSDHVVRLNGLP